MDRQSLAEKNASVAKACVVPAVDALGMDYVATVAVCAMVIVPTQRTNLEEEDFYGVKNLNKTVTLIMERRQTVMMTLKGRDTAVMIRKKTR